MSSTFKRFDFFTRGLLSAVDLPAEPVAAAAGFGTLRGERTG
jgi:hypothetical protein